MIGGRLSEAILTADGRKRIEDFLARHGGPGFNDGRDPPGVNESRGWSEVHAADGHVLRWQWSVDGSTTHMRFWETEDL